MEGINKSFSVPYPSPTLSEPVSPAAPQPNSIASMIGSNKFQFLMVRLKENMETIGIITLILFQFLMVRLKDCQISTTALERYLFQFLMVRLKDSTKSVICANNLISIPYGAIKRHFGMVAKSISCIFQFLMVRLKVTKKI